MDDHALHRRSRYCLQAVRTAKKLKFHSKHFIKMNGKQRITM